MSCKYCEESSVVKTGLLCSNTIKVKTLHNLMKGWIKGIYHHPHYKQRCYFVLLFVDSDDKLAMVKHQNMLFVRESFLKEMQDFLQFTFVPGEALKPKRKIDKKIMEKYRDTTLGNMAENINAPTAEEIIDQVSNSFNPERFNDISSRREEETRKMIEFYKTQTPRAQSKSGEKKPKNYGDSVRKRIFTYLTKDFSNELLGEDLIEYVYSFENYINLKEVEKIEKKIPTLIKKKDPRTFVEKKTGHHDWFTYLENF